MKQRFILLFLFSFCLLTSFQLIYFEDFESYEQGDIPDNWTVHNDSIQHIIDLDGNMVFSRGGRLDIQMPPIYDVRILWLAPISDTCYWTGFSFSTNIEGYYDPAYKYFYGNDYMAGDGLYISDPSVN